MHAPQLDDSQPSKLRMSDIVVIFCGRDNWIPLLRQSVRFVLARRPSPAAARKRSGSCVSSNCQNGRRKSWTPRTVRRKSRPLTNTQHTKRAPRREPLYHWIHAPERNQELKAHLCQISLFINSTFVLISREGRWRTRKSRAVRTSIYGGVAASQGVHCAVPNEEGREWTKSPFAGYRATSPHLSGKRARFPAPSPSPSPSPPEPEGRMETKEEKKRKRELLFSRKGH